MYANQNQNNMSPSSHYVLCHFNGRTRIEAQGNTEDLPSLVNLASQQPPLGVRELVQVRTISSTSSFDPLEDTFVGLKDATLHFPEIYEDTPGVTVNIVVSPIGSSNEYELAFYVHKSTLATSIFLNKILLKQAGQEVIINLPIGFTNGEKAHKDFRFVKTGTYDLIRDLGLSIKQDELDRARLTLIDNTCIQ